MKSSRRPSYRSRMRFYPRMGHFSIWPPTAAANLVLLALVAAFAAAQNPTLKTRTREEREREYQSSRRITLNVQATDAAGKPVSDLNAQDFTIFDNHQPRKLFAFHVIDGQAMNDATEVVILLDAVNSTAAALQAEKEGIFKFLAGRHGPLPYTTSFILWSNGHLKATMATTDRNAIGRAFVSMTKNLHSNACAPVDASLAEAADPDSLGSNSIGPHATEVAHCLQVHFKDSLAALDGIAQKRLTLGGRTILIWVGPGWPLLSDAEFKQPTPAVHKTLFDELVTVMHDLESAQITLDAVGPADFAREAEEARVDLHRLAAGTATFETAIPGSLALPVLAEQTGGLVSPASSDVAADLARFFDDAEWYYALSFIPPPAQSGVELRTIEVKVNRPGVNLRTATTYYLQP